MSDLKKPINKEEQLKFWKEKLSSYEEKLANLSKESPDRWWHDEYFDNQVKVLQDLILGAKERIKELSKEEK